MLSESTEKSEDFLNGSNISFKPGNNIKINISKSKVMKCTEKKSNDTKDIRLRNDTLT